MAASDEEIVRQIQGLFDEQRSSRPTWQNMEGLIRTLNEPKKDGFRNEDYGYVGNIGTQPKYSETAKAYRDSIKLSQDELNTIDKKIELLSKEHEIVSSISDLTGDIALTQANIDSNNNRRQDIEDEIMDISIQIADALSQQNQAIVDANELEAERLQDEIDRLTAIRDAHNANIEALDEENRELDKTLSKLNEELGHLSSINAVITDIKENEGDINTFVAKRAEKQHEINVLNAEYHKVSQNISKELAYHNKALEEGVTFQERMNHFAGKYLMNINMFSNGFSEMKMGFNSMLNNALELIKPWGTINQRASDYAKHIGTSASQFRKMQSDMLRFATSNSIERKYNTSTAELIKLQEQYNTVVGRRVDMSNNELESMAAMKTIAGEEGANQFATAFETFGLGIEESGSRMGDMFKEANKAGISFNKYTKNFLSNIKMAQNYTFAKGVNGLKEMAKRATEIKLDMQQVARFADKVSTVEGALQAGAGLSVLGGSFNQFADPMRMLYYGLNDAEGLEKNIEGMLGGMAYFDHKKGQMEVSAFNRQRIKAAAEATGMDYSQLMESTYAMGRRNILKPQLSKWSEDRQSLILNQAQMDKNGNGYVTINGEKKDIRSLTESDVRMLEKTGINDSDNIKTIAQTLLGWDEKLSGTKKAIEDQKALQAENVGLPAIAESILDKVAENAKTVAQIQMITQGILMAIGMMSMLNGGFNMGRSMGGGYGRTPMSNQPYIGGGTMGGGAMGGRFMGSAYNGTRQGINGNYVAGRQLGMTRTQAAQSAYRDARMAGMSRADARRFTQSAVRSNSTLGRMGNGLKGGLVRNANGIAMVGTIAGGIGGSMLQNNAQSHMNEGDFNGAVEGRYTGGSALQQAATWGGTGAMIGSFFGPWGTLIGGALGAIGGGLYGYFSAKDDYKKQELKHKLKQRGLNLQGEYSLEELKAMEVGGRRAIISRPLLAAKITNQEGIAMADLPNFKHGGIVSHINEDNTTPVTNNNINNGFSINSAKKLANGGDIVGNGTGTSDSIHAMLSNGEYVEPANVVKDPLNRQILETMRKGISLKPITIGRDSNFVASDSYLNTPRFSAGGLVTNVRNLSHVNSNTFSPSTLTSNSSNVSNSLNNRSDSSSSTTILTPNGRQMNPMTVEPIANFKNGVGGDSNVNVNGSFDNVKHEGTIRVVFDGLNVSKELTVSQQNQMVAQIMKQINITNHLGYDKNKHPFKFGNG